MRAPPVPQRIPPLTWRRPSFVWTPIALALAIGWPAALFGSAPPLQRLALAAGAIVFALALITLGASWALGRPPRTRRAVVLQVLLAGAITAFTTPFVLTEMLAAIADYERGDAPNFSFAMSLAMAPLALVLGLPVALISGTLFAWTALSRSRPQSALPEDGMFDRDVQPFR